MEDHSHKGYIERALNLEIWEGRSHHPFVCCKQATGKTEAIEAENNESTEVQTLGVIRIQYQYFEQV